MTKTLYSRCQFHEYAEVRGADDLSIVERVAGEATVIRAPGPDGVRGLRSPLAPQGTSGGKDLALPGASLATRRPPLPLALTESGAYFAERRIPLHLTSKQEMA